MVRPEISETLGLSLGLDILGPVSSGHGLENWSYPSLTLGLGLDHQEFPSLSLETETDF